MPVTASVRKALRASLAKRQQNLIIKADLRRAIKNVTTETLSAVVAVIDKAAKRDVIHKNKASRLKSNLTKQLVNGTTKTDLRAKKLAAKRRTKAVAPVASTTETAAK